MLLESWPPERLYVARPGPVGLATLTTAWLAIPAPVQPDFARLHGRRVRLRFDQPPEGKSVSALELALCLPGREVTLPRRNVRCETARTGETEVECTLVEWGRGRPAPQDDAGASLPRLPGLPRTR